MNIAIDIGNTHSKAAFYDGDVIIKTVILKDNIIKSFEKEVSDLKEKTAELIICSVVDIEKDFLKYLDSNFRLTIFNSTTKIPIINLYHSPLTMGMDRLASVIGVRAIYKSGNVLVIDAGTCITYDFLNANNEYLGGGISPGIMMRFTALNNYTGKLPLIQIIEENNLIGRDTMESIKSGVINGSIAEIAGIIDQYRWLYSDLKVIITGGDSQFFAINLKNGIFAAPHLVLQGLNEVLKFQTKR